MNFFWSGLLIGMGIFSISGCGKTEPQPMKEEIKTLPSWYLMPPAMTDEYLYGVGNGATPDEARNSALENMIAQLGVSIASSYESSLNLRKGYREYLMHTTSHTIKSEVAKLRISNYETVQSEKRAYNQFLTLIRSDRSQLTQGLIKVLDQKTDKIKTQASVIANSNVISRYRFYRASSNASKEMFSTLLVLNTLDRDFNDKPYLKSISKIDTAYQSLKVHMSFSLLSDTVSRGFNEEIRVALTDKKMYIVDEKRADNDHVVIALHSTVNYASSHGFDVARVILVIEIRDHHGKVLGGNRINLTGHATQGKTVALENTSGKLRDLIDKDGLMRVLGLHF